VDDDRLPAFEAVGRPELMVQAFSLITLEEINKGIDLARRTEGVRTVVV
jgi:hypothetical protein